MFVYYFVAVDAPFGQVERAVLDLLGGLPEAAEIAYRKGEELRSRLPTDGHAVAKTVRLRVGGTLRSEAETVIPLTWEATGTPGLFPRMEADLVVTALGAHLTHLALRGSYRPPLGGVGRALDRALLHRVAEMCVKGFVDRLAAAAEERLRPLPESGEPTGR